MSESSQTGSNPPDEAIELLKSDDGARIPDIADELDVSRSEAKNILNQIDEQYELGSSSDFRYRILREIESDWQDQL